MTDNKSQTRVSLGDGHLELEGSEAFVEKQLDLLRPFLEGLLKGQTKRAATTHNPAARQDAPSQSATGLDGFENLFVTSEKGIQILKDLPGESKATKSVNAALLLTLANTLTGNETTSFDDIRETCKSHGCLDSPNFAKTIKAEKDAFVFGGTERKQTVKLTVPGRKRADALADSLK